MRDGAMLGRIIETFVAMQLKADLDATELDARLFHLRTEQGRHEVDLLVELPDRRVIAFEVKVTTAPAVRDARHLVWLRERLGDAFLAGVVLHAGSRMFGLGDRIAAVPIGAMWARKYLNSSPNPP